MIFTAFFFAPLLNGAQTQEARTLFPKNYQEARAEFLRNESFLKKLVPTLELRTHEVPSQKIPGLTSDVLYLPPASGHRERLLILVSGIHGIEAHVGSALQNIFLREVYPTLKDPDLGVLVIHALNPYGFAQSRRVTENNVDLNRNLDIDRHLFAEKNEGYQKVSGLLNPQGAAAGGAFARIQFYARAVLAILEHSLDSLRRAVLKGQHEVPEGLYYGGADFEPQKEWLESELRTAGERYEHVLLIDLHTGYGERGRLHLFADRSPLLDADYLQKIFAGRDLDYGQKKDFYEVTGGMIIFAAKLMSPKTQFAGMVFEFGTLDSQKTLGSLDSIYRMTKENQLSHYGAESVEDETQIKDLFREMYFPSSPEWRDQVIQQFRDTIRLALRNQQAIPSQ